MTLVRAENSGFPVLEKKATQSLPPLLAPYSFFFFLMHPTLFKAKFSVSISLVLSFKNNTYLPLPPPRKASPTTKVRLLGVSRVPQDACSGDYVGVGLPPSRPGPLWLRERAPDSLDQGLAPGAGNSGVTPGPETAPPHTGLPVARKEVTPTLVFSVGTGVTYRVRTMLCKVCSQCFWWPPTPRPPPPPNAAPKKGTAGPSEPLTFLPHIKGHQHHREDVHSFNFASE